MKILNASLKKVWYDAIDRGTKTTEYRDMKDYWLQKLLDLSKYKGKSLEEIKEGLSKGTLELYPADWTHIKFHYGNDSMTFKIDNIKTYEGHKTFAIKLGERVNK